MSTLCFVFSYLFLDINLNNPFIKVLLPLFGIVALLLLCKKRLHYSLTNDLQLKKPPLLQLLMWLTLYLSWMLITDYFMNWRGAWDFGPWHAQPMHVSILRVLAVCFLGPILEELIFRGLLFYRFTKVLKINHWVVVILLAAVWAAMHYTYSVPVIAVIFVSGILLGAAMVKSRSLIVPIIMHICWNLYAIW